MEEHLDKQHRLNEVAQEIRTCQQCKLSHSRKLSVPGEGLADTEILFIGEGPGFYENEQGKPFVGAAGKFLSELLAHIGLDRKDVFITNVVKCRPPENRDPERDELTICGQYLERQIEIIDPQIIVTLGRISMGRYLPEARIGEVHGQAKWVDNRLIVAMYHPAAALHQPALKATILKDFARIPEYIQLNKEKRGGLETAVKTELQSVSAVESKPLVQEPARTIQKEETSTPVKPEAPSQLSLF